MGRVPTKRKIYGSSVSIGIKKVTCSTGAGPCVYIIKRGVLFIIIPNEHVETITAMFHLCNKFWGNAHSFQISP